MCEAKITVDAKTVESKAAKFNEKMDIVPEKTLAEEVKHMKSEDVIRYLENLEMHRFAAIRDIKKDFIDEIKKIDPDFDFSRLNFLVVDLKSDPEKWRKFCDTYDVEP